MKTVLLTLALLIGSYSAQATTARILGLGADEIDSEGSYYIDDDKNIFLNSANARDHSNQVMLEYGGEGQTIGSAGTTLDSDTKSKARGGFLMNQGNYTYGAYLGNESNVGSLFRIVSSSAASTSFLRTIDQQVDLFFAWGNANKFGVNLLYSKSKDESISAEEKAMVFRLGFKNDRWDAFANIPLGSESEGKTSTGADHSFKGKFGGHIGAGYKIRSDLKIYGFLKNYKWEQEDSTAAATLAFLQRGKNGTADGKFISYALGLGHTKKVSDSGTLFANIEFRLVEVELELQKNVEAKNTTIPITLAYENRVKEWLSLRGFVTHNLMSKRENNNLSSLNQAGEAVAVNQFGADTAGKSASIDDKTTFGMGATLHFGNLSVEGYAGARTRTQDKSLDLDNMLTRFGMTYKF